MTIRQLVDSDIQRLVDQYRDAYRQSDFRRAEEIRNYLRSRSIAVEVTTDGVRWRREIR